MPIKARSIPCLQGVQVTKRPTGFTHFNNNSKKFPPMTLTGEERTNGKQVEYQCDRGGKHEWIQVSRLVLATQENALFGD
jgi:hypothetical protein